MAQMVLSGAKWLPVSMTLAAALAAGIPYIFAVVMEQVPPFFPFIRHSAAYAPQSGIFNIFVTIATFLGIPTFALRYAVVKNREYLEDQRFRRLNKAAFAMGLLLNVCLIYTSNNPLGFQGVGKTKWILEVLVPHHVGALSICLCINIYVLMQAYVTYHQKRICNQNVFIHAVLSVCVVVSTWTAIIPLSSSLKDEASSLAEDVNHLVKFEYKEYSFYSTICALSEWSFTFLSLFFIASFYRDFKKMNVRLHLKPKRVISNNYELPTLSQQGNKEMTKI